MHLLRSNSSFLFLFLSQFFGAFNDNFYKNAMIMLITFKLSESAEQTGLLITLAAGLFILPFFLFSSFAGQLADRYSKTELIKKVNLAEVLIMLMGALALLNQQLELLFITLFLMGSQSAFFGPLKYAVLPEILDNQTLMRGNAMFSGSTFIAILLGSILGGIGVLLSSGTELMSVSIIVVAITGYLFSLFIKPTQAQSKDLPITLNVFKSTWQIVSLCRGHHRAFFAVLAISWFWFLGAILLSQIPSLVKYDLLADDTVVVAFLSAFSIGIAIGAGGITKLLKGQINLHWHGLFLGGISLLLLVSVWLIQIESDKLLLTGNSDQLINLWEFSLTWPINISLILLLSIAILGGAYIVPLYTLLQTHTPVQLRARMVAVNNIMNALFMVMSSVLVMIGYAFSLNLLTMLIVLAVVNLLVAVGLHWKQKKFTIKTEIEPN